jgi:asparagine synthase (glutamine-hydrolysing)
VAGVTSIASCSMRMNESQHHRGPDEGGLHVEPGVGLGHRRLSIIDLSTGQQPLYNEDQSVCVVFNGEIYNYQELIPELLALGHVFHTRSDTEVIVHAWEAWGEDCVRRFRGMFAFALWDRKRAKRSFWHATGWPSSRSTMRCCPTGLPAFRFRTQVAAGAWGPRARHRPAGGRGILRARLRGRAENHLSSGQKAAAGPHADAAPRLADGCAEREYWDVRFSLDNPCSLADACAQLDDKLSESIRLRMIAEVPLGAFLSGGVDSSAVVALMAGQSAEPVNTCSIASMTRLSTRPPLPRRSPTVTGPTITVTWSPATTSI